MTKDDLTLLIATLKGLEKMEYPVEYMWKKIMNLAGYPEDHEWIRFGTLAANHPWFKSSRGNPYHNEVHTAQVMWCGFILAPKLMIEQDPSWLPKYILALMFHDVEHSGKHNTYRYELELKAVSAFEEYMHRTPYFREAWGRTLCDKYGDWNEMIEFVKRIILATEVTEDVPRNIRIYENSQEHTLWDVLVVITQEADVMPSALPDIGEELGHKLALEWNDPSVATDEGRLKFLNFIRYVSKASHKLGIPEIIAEQKKTLENRLRNR